MSVGGFFLTDVPEINVLVSFWCELTFSLSHLKGLGFTKYRNEGCASARNENLHRIQPAVAGCAADLGKDVKAFYSGLVRRPVVSTHVRKPTFFTSLVANPTPWTELTLNPGQAKLTFKPWPI